MPKVSILLAVTRDTRKSNLISVRQGEISPAVCRNEKTRFDVHLVWVCTMGTARELKRKTFLAMRDEMISFRHP
jgi:hypothetical protein